MAKFTSMPVFLDNHVEPEYVFWIYILFLEQLFSCDSQCHTNTLHLNHMYLVPYLVYFIKIYILLNLLEHTSA